MEMIIILYQIADLEAIIALINVKKHKMKRKKKTKSPFICFKVQSSYTEHYSPGAFLSNKAIMINRK